MSRRRVTRLAALAAVILIGSAAVRPARAQVTREDSAAVLLTAAQRLNDEGQRPAAQTLLDYIRKYFAGTAAARGADSVLARGVLVPEVKGGGRTHLIAWSTLYGAFLGIAVPAMLGANDAAPYGVGLLVGGPAGFLAARSWSGRAQPSAGRAAAMTFGFRWGAYQAMGWRAVFDIGTTQECVAPGNCYGTTAGRSPWTALVLGGAGGLVAGSIAGRMEPTAGKVAFASHGAYWGTWLGLVGEVLADQSGDAALATVLIAGDAGLLAGAIAAPRGVTPGRVWATSALGIAGVAGGFGLDLIVQPSGDKTVLAIPAATGIIGLAYGWHATADMDRRQSSAGEPPIRFAGPVVPARLPAGLDANGRRVWRAGLLVPLVSASF